MKTTMAGFSDYKDNVVVLHARYRIPEDYDENGCLRQDAVPYEYRLGANTFSSLEETVLYISAAYSSDTYIHIDMNYIEACKFIELMRKLCPEKSNVV